VARLSRQTWIVEGECGVRDRWQSGCCGCGRGLPGWRKLLLESEQLQLGSDRFHQGYFILLPLVELSRWCNSTMPIGLDTTLAPSARNE